jgi:threonine dehydrogenase-like Zn-dependent dehydrogenase
MCKPVPDACADDAAAMGQPLAVALHAVGRSKAEPGQMIALLGVGGIGSFILAGAVAEGLGPIIAIDIDEKRLETARQLGATELVNARAEDPIKAIKRLTDGVGVHVFIEASGAPPGPAIASNVTRRGGRILLVGLPSEPPAVDLHSMIVREIEVMTTNAHVCDVDLPRSLEILTTTPLASTVLDRVIPLDYLIDDGLLALAEGRARGKIIVDPRA